MISACEFVALDVRKTQLDESCKDAEADMHSLRNARRGTGNNLPSPSTRLSGVPGRGENKRCRSPKARFVVDSATGEGSILAGRSARPVYLRLSAPETACFRRTFGALGKKRFSDQLVGSIELGTNDPWPRPLTPDPSPRSTGARGEQMLPLPSKLPQHFR